MQELNITANEAGQRLDKLLAKYLDKAPKSFLYKMLRKKNITLNGKKCSGNEKLAAGDIVRLFLSDETIQNFSTPVKVTQVSVEKRKNAGQNKKGTLDKNKSVSGRKKEKLSVLYEDEHVLFINKPVGMLSQKAKESDVSAVELLLDYLLESGQIQPEELRTFRPSICNRLDRNTSGLLAAGKSLAGLQEMNRFFKERTIAKYYRCLVNGIVKEGAYIKGYLTKDEVTNKVQISQTELPGSVPIETEYRALSAKNGVSLLEVHLITGKTHQIRAHLASVGHPIIGDYKYGNRNVNQLYQKEYGLKSQLLHAYRLEFPRTEGTLSYLSGKEFTAELPELFTRICKDKGVM